jgi:hypothetical protein
MSEQVTKLDAFEAVLAATTAAVETWASQPHTSHFAVVVVEQVVHPGRRSVRVSCTDYSHQPEAAGS